MKFKDSKDNEIKPEIKKLKKQETEKQYKPKITLFILNTVLVKSYRQKFKTIGSIEVQCYDIKFEKF